MKTNVDKQKGVDYPAYASKESQVFENLEEDDRLTIGFAVSDTE